MEQRVEELFHRALECDATTRSEFVESASNGDADLRREVESLLRYAGKGEQIFSEAIERVAATLPSIGIGDTLGPYRLIRAIGEGGMGTVYLAERADGEFRQQVAIKIVRWSTTALLARLRQERQILAQLQHPHIARLLDGGVSEQGWPYMVMEYCPGAPITEYCRVHGLSIAERLRLFCTACTAVGHAHRNLVIHRDLKPGNIFVTSEGELKLLDFGIAKLLDNGDVSTTATGTQWMTPDYASPEQVRGETVTTASDVYSLGAVLYELLTGAPPHRLPGHSPAEITAAVCDQSPERPGLGEELDHILLTALRKEPERRYSSVMQFAEDIERYLGHRPVMARPDTAAYRWRKFVRRNRVATAATVLAIASLVAGLGVASWQTKVARRQAQEARMRFAQVRKLANTVLFDLEPKIGELMGATPAREQLVKTALEYLDSLSTSAETDGALLGELAAAYQRVGDVQGEPARPNLGQRGNAVTSYRKAITAWKRAEAVGGDVDVALTRAYQKLYDVDGREETLQQASARADRAVAAHPGDAEAYALSIGTAQQAGTRRLNRSDAKEALVHFERARQVAEQWVSRFPGVRSQQALAGALQRVALATLHDGDAASAAEILQRTIRMKGDLVRQEPRNAVLRRALFKDHFLLGHALGNPEYFNLGRAAEAAAAYRQAIAISEGLLAADSSNALARGDVSDAYWALAVVLTENDPKAAIPLLRRSLDESLVLMRGSPSTGPFIQNAATSYIALAGALAKAGEYPGAVRNFREGLALQRDTAKSWTKQPGLRHNLISTLTQFGLALLASGDRKGAEENLADALSIAETVPRDNAFRGKIPDLAACYAARGKLSASVKNWEEARAWYQKSIGLLRELETGRIAEAYLVAKRRPILEALGECERRLLAGRS